MLLMNMIKINLFPLYYSIDVIIIAMITMITIIMAK